MSTSASESTSASASESSASESCPGIPNSDYADVSTTVGEIETITCNDGYSISDGKVEFSMTCESGGWSSEETCGVAVQVEFEMQISKDEFEEQRGVIEESIRSANPGTYRMIIDAYEVEAKATKLIVTVTFMYDDQESATEGYETVSEGAFEESLNQELAELDIEVVVKEVKRVEPEFSGSSIVDPSLALLSILVLFGMN